MFGHVDRLNEVWEVPKKITRKDRALSAPLLLRPKLSKPTIKENDVHEARQSLLGRKLLEWGYGPEQWVDDAGSDALKSRWVTSYIYTQPPDKGETNETQVRDTHQTGAWTMTFNKNASKTSYP